jgi:RNA polymerase sigma-70 factor (ECF subfamily)
VEPDTIATQHLTETERELLAAVRRGEREAATALLRPLLPSLIALARRLVRDTHLAEDLTQETLLRACPALATFRGESSLRTWLLRILVRLAMDSGRARQRRPSVAPLAAEVPDHLPAPPAYAEARELQDRMREAIERLPAREALALHLRAVEGMDYASIAAVLECSNGAARMLVLTARRRVLERLGEHLEP